jgi:regulator of sirC expression with transglutaminase-like and TPR domain
MSTPLPETDAVGEAFAESPEFQRLIRREAEVQLARIALEIARDAYPYLQIDAYLLRLQRLAERARARCRPDATPRDVIGQINWVLFEEEGLRANQDDYYDPRNSYLNEVLDRRLGIPISLCVLYWTVAEQLGLSMAGVSLPAHFMLRIEEAGETRFVDPFHAGAVYDREDCERKLTEIANRPIVLTDTVTAPCSIDVVVARMLRNLKAIYANSGDLMSLLPVQRRLVAVSRREASELRDLGLLCTQTDRLGEAIDALQAYLDSAPTADDAQEITALLASVRRQTARWN